LADTATAAEQLSLLSAGLPTIAIGYSFGAIMGTRVAPQDPSIVAMVGVAPPLKRVGFEHLANCSKPCLMVSGQDDFVYDAEAAKRLVDTAGPNLVYERPVGDHFFVGREADLADRVARFAERIWRMRMVKVDASK
jgi:alpha/beta superfamily hydrolase